MTVKIYDATHTSNFVSDNAYRCNCAYTPNTYEECIETMRSSVARHYFESGCLCIDSGVLEKLPAEVDNWKAVEYYHNNCKCSRNYDDSYEIGDEL